MNPIGRRAEDFCAQFLRRAGLRLLERNWRCRHGEIDLIAQEGETLVFFEVRLRRPGSFGSAAESVHAPKRRRLIAAARAYLSGRAELPCRFDVLALASLDPPELDWIRDALSETGGPDP